MKIKRRKALLFTLSLLYIISLNIPVVWSMHPGASDIILQAFHWRGKSSGEHGEWYNLIASKADDIKETGITMVWFPPPSKTPRWDLDEYGDWASANGYVPMDYYDLGEFRQWVQDGWPPDNEAGNNMDDRWYQHPGVETLYGSRAELEGAINALHDRNIKVIADIVLNHRGPRQRNACGERISWGDTQGRVSSGKMFWGHKQDCNPPEIYDKDGGSGLDDGESAFGPNISHQNINVKNQFKEWLLWLKKRVGFDGWRYDYVKGVSPVHIKEYNDHTLPYWSVGEFWDYSNTDTIISWINSTHTDESKKSTAFDFPSKKILTDNFGTRNFSALKTLPGLMGRWPQKAVTFLDNHDTHSPHKNPYQFPDNRVLEGYAYILTHPGVPCIYWQHFYDSGSVIHDKIRELAQIRKEQGISNTSSVNILRAEKDLYAAEIDGKVVIRLGIKPWTPAGLAGYTVRAEYGEYKIWTKVSGKTKTLFRIKKDVGFGNFISIRGSIPQLNNWTQPGKTCNWSTGNVWECTLYNIQGREPFEWKALRNDSLWESGPNHSGSGGDTFNIVPGGL